MTEIQPKHWRMAVVVVGVFLFAGIFHPPWKGDDANHLLPILALLDGSLPALQTAGHGPLFYLLAAGIAQPLSGLIAPYNAARLVASLCTGVMLYSVTRSALKLNGPSSAFKTLALTTGALGLVIEVHEIQPYTALIGSHAILLWGLIHTRGTPELSPLVPLGAGLSIISHPLLGGLPACVLLLVYGLSKRARPLVVTAILTFLLTMLCLMAGGDFAPPSSLTVYIDRLLSFLAMQTWMAWPLWPLAVWTLGLRHLHASIQPLRLALWLALLTLMALTGWQTRDSSAMGIISLPWLAIIISLHIDRLRRGAANAMKWFGLCTMGLLIASLWLAWAAQFTDWPPGLARHFNRYGSGFERQVVVPGLILALLISAGWAITTWRNLQTSRFALAHWALGTASLWGVAAALHLPWYNHQKSYETVAIRIIEAVQREGVEHVCLQHTPAALDAYLLSHQPKVYTRHGENRCQMRLSPASDRLGERPGQVFPHRAGLHLEQFRLTSAVTRDAMP